MNVTVWPSKPTNRQTQPNDPNPPTATDGDLKPSNVLLKSQPGGLPAYPPPPGLPPADFDPSSLLAKVSDFGLSWCMDATASHVSSCHAGTMTHMSPELLLEGKASKASDVYSYGG